MMHGKTLIIALLLLLNAGAVKANSGTNQREVSTAKGRIAFAWFENDAPASRSVYIYTINPDGSDVQLLFKQPIKRYISLDCACHLKWSFDYRHLYFKLGIYWLDEDFRQWIVAADGSTSKGYTADYTEFNWSPDGKYLAYLYKKGRNSDTKEYELYIAAADGSNPRRFSKLNVSSYVWGHDSKKIALASRGSVYVMPIEDDTKFTRLTSSDVGINQLTWSPDSKYMTFVYRKGLYLLEVETGKRRRLTDEARLIWSPDSQKILNASYTDLTLLDIATGAKVELPVNNNPDGINVSWSPDRMKILISSQRHRYADITIVNAEKSPQITPLNLLDDSVLWGGTWSPEGEQIAYAKDRQICIRDADGTNHCITAQYQYDQLLFITWSAGPTILTPWEWDW